MNLRLRRFGLIAAALALWVPAAWVATFALTPLWRWLERGTGLESIGHSGPDKWCFYFVYGAGIVVVAAVAIWRRRRSR